MLVTLLYFDGCPSWHTADANLRTALTRVDGADIRVERRQVTTPEQAAAEGFRGSPTLLVDGRDAFADADAPVGLSCRVYRTPQGLVGAPTVEQLVDALTRGSAA